VESGTWIIVGCVIVVAMIVYFRRVPAPADTEHESLAKRWFG
jgi:hypothetical protein